MSANPTNPTPAAAPPAKGKRLTEAEWSEAKALYETGQMTKTDLASKFGISKQSMGEGLNARGAVYGSKSKVVEEATIDAMKNDASKRVEEIAAFKEKQKKMIELVQNLSIKAVTDKVRKQQPISDAKADIVTLKALMGTIRMGRDELYHIYDLHRDPDGASETEEFIVSEYTPDEIAAINQARFGSDPDADLDAVAASLEDSDAGDIDSLLEE